VAPYWPCAGSLLSAIFLALTAPISALDSAFRMLPRVAAKWAPNSLFWAAQNLEKSRFNNILMGTDLTCTQTLFGVQQRLILQPLFAALESSLHG
jgi:hypothetical protein